EPRGGAWNQQGTILFAPTADKGLYTVPSSGGNPTPVTHLSKAQGETTHRFPSFLPNGRDYLFFSYGTGGGPQGLYFGSLDSTGMKRIVDAVAGLFVPPSTLLFQQHKKLFAQTFDPKEAKLIGEPRVLMDQLGSEYDVGGSFG